MSATETVRLQPACDGAHSLHRLVMPLCERVANYHRATGFPESLFVGGDGRIVGTWIMGNDYRVKSEYYGGYPAGYLRRVKALFPDKTCVLHLFSGRVDKTVMPGETVDVNPELAPDYLDDAQTLERVPLEKYDIVMADPPYSVEDCEQPPPSDVRMSIIWDKGPAFGAGDLRIPWKPCWEEIYIGGHGWEGRRDEGVLRGPCEPSWNARQTKARCYDP